MTTPPSVAMQSGLEPCSQRLTSPSGSHCALAAFCTTLSRKAFHSRSSLWCSEATARFASHKLREELPLAIRICIAVMFSDGQTKRPINDIARQNPMRRKWGGAEGTDSIEVRGSVKVWGWLTLSVHELEGGGRSSGQSSYGPLPAGPRILCFNQL